MSEKIKKALLTLSENLMSPVGLAPDEETSACLCIEIRKASTPDTPTLFPAKQQQTAVSMLLQEAFMSYLTMKNKLQKRKRNYYARRTRQRGNS